MDAGRKGGRDPLCYSYLLSPLPLRFPGGALILPGRTPGVAPPSFSVLQKAKGHTHTLTNVGLFVGFDDFCQFKVPRNNGHLQAKRPE